MAVIVALTKPHVTEWGHCQYNTAQRLSAERASMSLWVADNIGGRQYRPRPFFVHLLVYFTVFYHASVYCKLLYDHGTIDNIGLDQVSREFDEI